MKITVPLDIERTLTAQARKRGTTAELVALDTLRERFLRKRPRRRSRNADGNRHKTLAEFLEGYVGVLHSSECVEGGARMSEASGKKVAQALLLRRRSPRVQ